MSVCKVKISNFMFEFDTKNERDLVEQIAHAQEVFDHKCGKCQSTNLRFIVRTDDEDNKYYELKCNDCYAKMQYGCHKKGDTLFPKRADSDGKLFPDNGWLKWDREKKVSY